MRYPYHTACRIAFNYLCIITSVHECCRSLLVLKPSIQPVNEFFFSFCRSACIVTVIVLVNNSTLKTTRGTVNGLGQTLVAVFRSFGPAVGALLFAWSEDNG